ncbi:amino acid adenylation domain-containing protein [Nocardia sp. NPDC024068]|uniref:amino acid adenylation domain-containing protein n=1 Tax=Nocardia sp. NPDC024068 TaxID=3157197 RepID=UPI0033CDDF79
MVEVVKHHETEPDHPLSAAQLRWWVAQQLHPEIPNTVAMYLDLHGPLDIGLMRECGHRAAGELESPNIRLYSDLGQPRQRPDSPLELRVADFTGHPDPVAAASEAMADDYGAPLKPLTAALTVGILFRVAAEHHLLYLRSHHMVLDGAGAVALLRRTGELYRAGVAGTTAGEAGALDTAGLLAAENDYRRSARSRADREFWQEALAGLADPVGLAGHPAAPRPRPHRVSAALDPEVADSIAPARDRLGATFGELVVAAFACYLSRLTDSDDTVLALPLPARTTAVLRRSAGTVANVVPLRLTGIGRSTVGGAIADVHRRVLGALRHQRYPYEDIQRDRAAGRVVRGGFGPVINVLGFVEPLRLGPLTGTAQLLSSGPVEDLLVNGYQMGPDERTVTLDFHGNPARYSATTLAWYHRGFLAYLGAFLTAPADAPVPEPDLPERAGSGTGPTRNRTADAGSGQVRTLSDLLRGGPAHPDAVAIGDGTRSLTYRELDEQARRWAGVLRDAGVRPGTAVAVVVPRSVESVLAVWAVATCGGCLVPIDPDDPPDRISTVLAGARVRAGLTISAIRAVLPAGAEEENAGVPDAGRAAARAGAIRWFDLDRPAPATTSAGSIRPGPDHPAYLIHTSGTTGKPKGVLVGHRGLGWLTDHLVEHYGLDADSVVLHAHSPAFDAHLLELLGAFAAGARLVVAAPDAPMGAGLGALVRTAGITHLLSTPGILATLDPAELPDLRVVVTGGETPPPELVRRWAPLVRLYNGYGPTEATVMTMQSDPLPPGDPVLIGPALPGVRARLLDRRLRQAPAGGQAELYLGGPGVALGYLGDPAATAARFVADPAGGGRRLYRTGDRVRPDPAGYEYLGRADRQLSLHGRRIEPAEIESTLTAGPEIAQAAVTVAGGPGPAARLIGYIVAAPGHPVDTAATLRRLRAALPAALVPAVLVPIDRIPLTPSGKLDRGALPEPVPVRDYRPPETELQRLVAGRVGSALGRESVGLDDDFFALGGNSILGVALSADLAERTGAPVTVRWLYTAPTVADLAERLAAHEPADAAAAVNGIPVAGSGAGSGTVRLPGTESVEGMEVLLPLRRGGDRPPLFCFHSAVPLAWCYAGLSRHIEDRRVYGVQSPVLTASGPEPGTADDLAEHYVRAILRVQPEGPYHLLGWSLGGQLAHAAGVRLRDRGHAVALLVMLDSVVFPPDSPPPSRPRMRDLLTHLLGDEHDGATAAEEPEITAAEAAAELATAGANLGTGLTAGQLERLHRAYVGGVEISHRYRPRVFDGDLLYFSATRGVTELVGGGLWRPYITGELIEHPVDAAHGQLTNVDVVAGIGPVLARHLAGLGEPAGSR